MKTKTMEVYFCDYCNKLYQLRHACEKHEQYCKKSPANQHKCFEFCEHLERTLAYAGGSIEFVCEVTGKSMYSYIAEKVGPRIMGCLGHDVVRMPLDCGSYSPDDRA